MERIIAVVRVIFVILMISVCLRVATILANNQTEILKNRQETLINRTILIKIQKELDKLKSDF